MATADLVAAELMATQRGVFSRTQLLARSVPQATITRRLRTGQWRTLGRGVMTLSGLELSWRGRCTAALLSTNHGVLSHESAARLHQLDGLAPGRSRNIHLSSTSRTRPSQLFVFHQPVALPDSDTTQIAGLRCTSVARTVTDLARTVRPHRIERILDAAVRQGSVSLDEFALRLAGDDHTQLPGTRHLRDLVSRRRELAGVPDSELERTFLRLVDRHGLPKPIVQFLPPWGEAHGFGVVDFAYPDRRLLIELDGWDAHGGRTAFETDRRRDQQAAAAGWTTLRFTWAQVTKRPDQVVETLRAWLSRSA